MNTLIQSHITNAMSYADYHALIDRLLAEDKTTGENQSPAYVEYAKINAQRMHRLDKTIHLEDDLVKDLKSIDEKLVWVVLSEGWCGDAAQNLPVIAAMAAQNPLIDLRIVLRDEHLELMDAYLTNGGRGIPKLIVARAEDLEVVGEWGPRPAAAQQMVMDYKAKEVKEPYSEFVIQVQKWYTADKTHAIQNEFRAMIPVWKAALKKQKAL